MRDNCFLFSLQRENYYLGNGSFAQKTMVLAISKMK